VKTDHSAVLLISCQDRPGLVTLVTQFIHHNRGNIVHLDEHVDMRDNVFFMRVEWTMDDFLIPRDHIKDAVNHLALGSELQVELYFSDEPIRLALFVSKDSHCLYDILARYEAGELGHVEIPVIVSNHDVLEKVGQRFGIPFKVFPIQRENKQEQEKREVELLRELQVDTVVMARYMQILSNQFIQEFPNNVINIHHSFLPAFAGAKPYHQAYERGVKIVGATSHYATPDLDEGPIIEQDIIHVTHKDSVTDLVRKGKDLEKVVLARAIWWHTKRKVLVKNNRTVVFR